MTEEMVKGAEEHRKAMAVLKESTDKIANSIAAGFAMLQTLFSGGQHHAPQAPQYSAWPPAPSVAQTGQPSRPSTAYPPQASTGGADGSTWSSVRQPGQTSRSSGVYPPEAGMSGADGSPWLPGSPWDSQS